MPAAPHWSQFAYLEAIGFGDLVVQRLALKEAADDIGAQIEGLNLEMGALMDTVGVRTVLAELDQDQFTITRTGGGGGSHIDGELLRDHGVPDWVIDRSTIANRPRRRSISVARVKKEEE